MVAGSTAGAVGLGS